MPQNTPLVITRWELEVLLDAARGSLSIVDRADMPTCRCGDGQKQPEKRCLSKSTTACNTSA